MREMWNGRRDSQRVLLATAQDEDAHRIPADRRLLDQLSSVGFDGPRWRVFEAQLVATVAPLLLNWVTSGQLVASLPVRTRWAPGMRSYGQALREGRVDAGALSREALRRSVVSLRRVLRERDLAGGGRSVRAEDTLMVRFAGIVAVIAAELLCGAAREYSSTGSATAVGGTGRRCTVCGAPGLLPLDAGGMTGPAARRQLSDDGVGQYLMLSGLLDPRSGLKGTTSVLRARSWPVRRTSMGPGAREVDESAIARAILALEQPVVHRSQCDDAIGDWLWELRDLREALRAGEHAEPKAGDSHADEAVGPAECFLHLLRESSLGTPGAKELARWGTPAVVEWFAGPSRADTAGVPLVGADAGSRAGGPATGDRAARVVQHFEAEVSCGPELRVVVPATFEYAVADPYAVWLRLTDGVRCVEWVLGRELLAEGTDRPAGLGDAEVWPLGDLWGDTVGLALNAVGGTARVDVPGGRLRGFLRCTNALVSPGHEHEYIDLDAFLSECGPGGRGA